MCSRSRRCCSFTNRSPAPSRSNPFARSVQETYGFPLSARLPLRGGHPGCLLESELLDCDLAHLELLDLARDGHRERVGELPIARDLECRDLAFAPCGELVAGDGSALPQLDPGHHLFAVLL